MAQLATVAAFGFPDLDPGVLLPGYRELGCEACQFYRNPAAPPTPRDAKRLAEDAGLTFDSIHGLFGPDYDPSCPDERVRRAAIEVYSAEADLAVELGCSMVVVHPAPLGEKRGLPAGGSVREAPMRRSMEELAAIGERKGTIFLIENIPVDYLYGSDAAGLAGMIRELGHPRVRMCFDTGHAHMNGHAPSALEACLDVVAYVHVHDNDGRSDSHMIPGDGSLPWDEMQPLLSSLPENTPAMLELFLSPQKLEEVTSSGLGVRLSRWLATG